MQETEIQDADNTGIWAKATDVEEQDQDLSP
jgi:hypothetical protein